MASLTASTAPTPSDCDGDLVDDATDTHPADPNEQTDMDGDGIGTTAIMTVTVTAT